MAAIWTELGLREERQQRPSGWLSLVRTRGRVDDGVERLALTGWERDGKGMGKGWETDGKRMGNGWERGWQGMEKGWDKAKDKHGKGMGKGFEREVKGMEKGWKRDGK